MIGWMFFLFIGLLGLSDRSTAASMAIWVGVALISILVHELGHAFAARRLGSTPTITLYGLGGLTYWQPKANATRWHHISVALAGPGSGMLLGLVVWVSATVAGGYGTGNVRFFVVVMLWINLGWGLVNLVPVLPLDGGHVMAELLPGNRERRWRLAAKISVGIAAVAAVALFVWGLQFAAILMVFILVLNVKTVRQPAKDLQDQELEVEARAALKALSTGDDDAKARSYGVAKRLSGPRQASFKVGAVETAALSHHDGTARALLAELPGAAPPALFALVTVSETYGLRGVEELEEIFGRTPSALHARWLMYALSQAGRPEDMLSHLHNVPAPQRSPELVAAVVSVADWAGEPVVASQARLLAPGNA
jgi:Zn-dependent protease